MWVSELESVVKELGCGRGLENFLGTVQCTSSEVGPLAKVYGRCTARVGSLIFHKSTSTQFTRGVCVMWRRGEGVGMSMVGEVWGGRWILDF